MLTLYGINNCDTVKKARTWLESNGIDYRFHDLRSDGLAPKELNGWVKALGWETVLNKKSTTFRQLGEKQRSNLDVGKAVALMLEYPTLIKRPVLCRGKQVVVGFDPHSYREFCNA